METTSFPWPTKIHYFNSFRQQSSRITLKSSIICFGFLFFSWTRAFFHILRAVLSKVCEPYISCFAINHSIIGDGGILIFPSLDVQVYFLTVSFYGYSYGCAGIPLSLSLTCSVEKFFNETPSAFFRISLVVFRLYRQETLVNH